MVWRNESTLTCPIGSESKSLWEISTLPPQPVTQERGAYSPLIHRGYRLNLASSGPTAYGSPQRHFVSGEWNGGWREHYGTSPTASIRT